VLTERRATVLGLVVHEYISTAIPVSSKALVDRYDLGVSPATIRNELARLEEDGYITHPHTSAGRVPSDQGYRVYVEALMAEEAIDADERRTIEHQFYQASGGLDEWLSLGAAVLASAVGNVAVITRPRRTVAHLKNVQLVHLHDASLLVVAVMDDGRVQQRLVTLGRPTSQAELTNYAEDMNARFSEADARRIRAAIDEDVDAERARVAGALAELVDEHERSDDTYLDGVSDVLGQPEFQSPDRMLEAVQHLEAYELRRALPSTRDVAVGHLRVVIGGENRSPWMREWSVIVASYGAGGASGMLAVVGPTRMQYARTVPRVRYFATLMSEVLHAVGA
jgi:heat-inducible transcriptional repressor